MQGLHHPGPAGLRLRQIPAHLGQTRLRLGDGPLGGLEFGPGDPTHGERPARKDGAEQGEGEEGGEGAARPHRRTGVHWRDCTGAMRV